jgi:hypothetical protein
MPALTNYTTDFSNESLSWRLADEFGPWAESALEDSDWSKHLWLRPLTPNHWSAFPSAPAVWFSMSFAPPVSSLDHQVFVLFACLRAFIATLLSGVRVATCENVIHCVISSVIVRSRNRCSPLPFFCSRHRPPGNADSAGLIKSCTVAVYQAVAPRCQHRHPDCRSSSIVRHWQRTVVLPMRLQG